MKVSYILCRTHAGVGSLQAPLGHISAAVLPYADFKKGSGIMQRKAACETRHLPSVRSAELQTALLSLRPFSPQHVTTETNQHKRRSVNHMMVPAAALHCGRCSSPCSLAGHVKPGVTGK